MDNIGITLPKQPEDINQWKSKLIGKAFVDNKDMLTMSASITKDDLPSNSRVLPPGAFKTCDYRTDRLNVVLDDTNTVTGVYYG
ncbi:hypothetical protein BX666DRAFT_1859165 [Dichotomocladium elegans]|nr:hypothetical protein BX666DRAFT_1859165 [Dichotomocladium elegans]